VDDELAKVNPSLLRDATTGCPRRLALEHLGQGGTRPSDVRFRVSETLESHARIAQLELGPPNVAEFVGDPRLTSEERALYDHAAGWYLALFGGRAARTVDLGDDTWARDRPDLGVRLTSRPPLAFEDDRGLELRVLHYNARRAPDPLLDDVEVRLDVLRFAHRAQGSLRIEVADLVRGEHVVVDVEPATVDELEAWLQDSIGRLRAAVDKDRPRIGPDCGWCRFVAGCKAHAA